MKLVSKKQMIDGVAEKWERSYPLDLDLKLKNGKTIKQVHKELFELNPKTEEEIAEIIGNNTWTSCICDECERDCDFLIKVGTEDKNISLCKDCLSKGLKLIYKII